MANHDQELTANQDQPPGERHPAVSPLSVLGSAIPLLVTASAAIAALAVFAGWRYTREYYREFGIDPGALDFSPYDYALRSDVVLVPFVGVLALLIPLYVVLRYGVAPMIRVKLIEESDRSPMAAVFATIIMTGATLCYYLATRGLGEAATIALVLAPSIVGMVVVALSRKPLFTSAGAFAVALGMLALFLAVPESDAKREAENDRDHLERFPIVSIVSTEDLGLRHQEGASNLWVYGPFRLILHNKRMYYLVWEDAPDETVGVPEEFIVHVRFHRPSWIEPAVMESEADVGERSGPK